MNETLKTLIERRSCRSYKSDPIPTEVLDQILEAGSYAATGMGKQSPIMIAVTDKKTRDQLSKMNAAVMGASNDPFYGAPVVIVVLANRAVPTYLYDGSLVMGNLMNAAFMGASNDPFYGAPVVIVVLADRTVPTYLYDGSLVMGNLMNAAHSLGIASCWIHRAKEEFDSAEGKAILKELGIEGDYEGIGHCILGYAAQENKTAAPRKENYIYRI